MLQNGVHRSAKKVHILHQPGCPKQSSLVAFRAKTFRETGRDCIPRSAGIAHQAYDYVPACGFLDNSPGFGRDRACGRFYHARQTGSARLHCGSRSQHPGRRTHRPCGSSAKRCWIYTRTPTRAAHEGHPAIEHWEPTGRGVLSARHTPQPVARKCRPASSSRSG